MRGIGTGSKADVQAFSLGEKVAEGRMRDNVLNGRGLYAAAQVALIRRRVRRHLLPKGEGFVEADHSYRSYRSRRPASLARRATPDLAARSLVAICGVSPVT